MTYPDNLTEELDFSKVMQALAGRAWCPAGRQLLESQAFLTDMNALEEALDAVQEMRLLLESGSTMPTLAFVETADIMRQLATEGLALEPEQFARLHRLIRGGADLLRFFTGKERRTTYPLLSSLCGPVTVEAAWYREIEKVIDLESAEVLSTASPELQRIRTRLSKLRSQQDAAFNKALRHYGGLGFLDEQRESWREGRRVLAVRSEHKRQVDGLVIDISGSGHIAFMEPGEVRPYEAERSEYLVLESREIRAILLRLSLYLHPHREAISRVEAWIARLDALQAKASLAASMNAVRPVLSRTAMNLRQARHPILEKHLRAVGKAIVPLDLSLDAGRRILIISGPNAGGKSVAMKTAGLMQLMAQAGLHIPAAEGSTVRVFSAVFADIGDDQSLEDDLSTYSSHLAHMAGFLRHAGPDAFFLIDELGSGTDPAYGGPIAEAILEALHEKQAWGVVTTHYSNLKDLAGRAPGMQNGAMAFDQAALAPAFLLIQGQAGASYALEVAARSGLPPDVLTAARSKLGTGREATERSLTQLQHEKQYLKGIRKSNQQRSEQLEKLVADYQALTTRMEREQKKLLRSYEERLLADYNEANRRLEALVREARQAANPSEKAVEVRQEVDEKRRDLSAKITREDLPVVQENPAAIEVGSVVRLEDNPLEGVVTEIRKGRATVMFGNLTTTVPMKKLVHLHAEQPVQADTPATPAKTPGGLEEQSRFDLELDLRGKYKDEAIGELERFLDRAVLFGVHRLRIVHGRGSGALRELVRQTLKQFPFVTSFSHESPEHGGDGVTVVELE